MNVQLRRGLVRKVGNQSPAVCLGCPNEPLGSALMQWLRNRLQKPMDHRQLAPVDRVRNSLVATTDLTRVNQFSSQRCYRITRSSHLHQLPDELRCLRTRIRYRSHTPNIADTHRRLTVSSASRVAAPITIAYRGHVRKMSPGQSYSFRPVAPIEKGELGIGGEKLGILTARAKSQSERSLGV